jgi:hypothetical protein
LSIVADRPLAADPDALIAEARRRTGLQDFGPNRFDASLRSQVTAAATEGNLTEPALANYLQVAVRNLSMMLRMQDFFVRYPEIAAQKIVAPVVIIGLQRTGTSKLFWNITADPQWNVLYTWQALNPIPPDGWKPGMPDGRLAEAEAWCEQQKFMSKAHHFQARAPEMEALLMAQTFMLNGGNLLVPTHQKWLETADFLPVYRHLRRQLQFLQWQNRAAPGRRWILKSPPHLLSLNALMDVFPDARLVMTHRHPRSSVGSMIKLGEMQQEQAARSVNRAGVRDSWFRIMTLSIQRFMEFREHAAKQAVIDVRFSDLVDAPLPVTRAVYAATGMPHTRETEEAVDAWHRANPRHSEGRFDYNLADYGLTDDDIERAFAPYIREYSPLF